MNASDIVVDFWNVGQGDCSVIKLPTGGIIIIDVGGKGSPLIEWLAEGHRRALDIHAIIITHNDSDHAGALPSIVEECKSRIGSIWMLQDRPKNDPRFQSIFRAALQGEQEGYYQITGLQAGQEIWSDVEMGYELKVHHPSFSQISLASKPNDCSGVIILDYKGSNLITWPGDLKLNTTASVLSGYSPNWMVGPHHGGPSDYPTKAVRKKLAQKGFSDRRQQMRECVKSIDPELNYISVGSNNSHNHPRPGYILMMAQNGAKVVCSQLTCCCDRRGILNRKPVFQGEAVLGLRAPKSGVSCRGALRVYITNGGLIEDEYAGEHRKRVQKLYRPQCLKGA